MKITLIIFLISYLSFLSIRTFARNFEWRDPITFYTVSLKQSPLNIPMRNNLAMAYAENGNTNEAIKQYIKLISLTDVYPHTHHNLANAYLSLGKTKEAEDEYLKAIKIDPNFHFSYYSLLRLYEKSGQKDKYDELFKKIQSMNFKGVKN